MNADLLALVLVAFLFFGNIVFLVYVIFKILILNRILLILKKALTWSLFQFKFGLRFLVAYTMIFDKGYIILFY